MSEQDKSQQTEDATPKKKEQLRKEGKLATSTDAVAAGALLFGLVSLGWVASHAAADVASLAERAFRLRDAHEPVGILLSMRSAFVDAILPVLLAAMVGAVAVGLVQTRAYFSLSNLAPKPERFSPLKQLAKILPGRDSAIALLKQVLKLAAVGAIVSVVLKTSMPMFVGFAATPLEAIAVATLDVATQVLRIGVAAFVSVAAIDYILAKRKYDQDAKMSKRDVRDEMKQDQGDPLVKGRQRKLMRELIASGGGSVADATVLVTNPTHISVALRYDPEQDAAPMILAMGEGEKALAMRREARQAGVPIVENKPFARAMYKDGKTGDMVPAELFGAAATVIAHVMSLGRVRP